LITSLSNERVKLARALQSQAKTRRKEQKIALEGVRLIRDAVERGGYIPEFILYDPDAVDTPEIIRHVTETEQPQGIIAVLPMPASKLPTSPQRVLILDAIRDPGNEGTILRTAAAAGVDAVLLSPGCVDMYNNKVLRGGMGAHFRLTIAARSWAEIDDYCRDLTIYLADMDGDRAYDAVDWTQPHALIIGGEAHGASADAESLAAERVFIPMAAEAESLNAAIAAGVLLFEAARQKRSAR
jgi:TrmH family RNA methyltransferase